MLLAGTFDFEDARNRLIAALLRRAGFQIDVLHVPLWGEQRYALLDAPRWRLTLAALRAYSSLAWKLLRLRPPDVVLVLYPGHLDMPVVGAIARLRGFPVIFDMFLSLHETVVGDRRLRGGTSFIGRLTRLVDRVACRLATRVLADTPEDLHYFAEATGVPQEGFRVLWVGAPEDIFHPQDDIDPEPRLVLFYGTFIKLQGIDTIVQAAKQLEGHDVRFLIIGEGQERPRIESLLRTLNPQNVEMRDAVPLEQLPREIARATLCLGIFGTTPKAKRVVPNKVFQCIAVGRPVLTAETPAIRSGFAGEVAVVPPGDPSALATAIRGLVDDPERLASLGAAGRARFKRDYSEEALSRMLASYINEVVRRAAVRHR